MLFFEMSLTGGGVIARVCVVADRGRGAGRYGTVRAAGNEEARQGD
jgi:hypothetical protein